MVAHVIAHPRHPEEAGLLPGLRAEPPRLRGGSWQDGKDLDPAGRESTDPATPATGFRCVVLPFTPVQALEVDAWTPVVPTREELPRLVGAPTRVAPTRPLAVTGRLRVVTLLSPSWPLRL